VFVHAVDRCSCAHANAHINRRTHASMRRTNDKAQAVAERAGAVATDGLCCYGGSSRLRKSPLVVLLVISLIAFRRYLLVCLGFVHGSGAWFLTGSC
jgi:hypothetical protein